MLNTLNLIVKTRFHFTVLKPIRKCVLIFQTFLKPCPPLLECNGYVDSELAELEPVSYHKVYTKQTVWVVQVKNVYIQVHVCMNFNIVICFFLLFVNISEFIKKKEIYSNRLATIVLAVYCCVIESADSQAQIRTVAENRPRLEIIQLENENDNEECTPRFHCKWNGNSSFDSNMYIDKDVVKCIVVIGTDSFVETLKIQPCKYAFILNISCLIHEYVHEMNTPMNSRLFKQYFYCRSQNVEGERHRDCFHNFMWFFLSSVCVRCLLLAGHLAKEE